MSHTNNKVLQTLFSVKLGKRYTKHARKVNAGQVSVEAARVNVEVHCRGQGLSSFES
jgi:hypothetical protein